MMITYATTFFKPFFFEAALSVNLTTMLVMTTIFISKMEGLPSTSATKMIDYWLILCQLVPFAQVVLLTAMEFLREEKQDCSGHYETDNRETNDQETRESRDIPQKKTRFMLSMFIVIGKLQFPHNNPTNDPLLSRDKGSASCCSCYLLCLLWLCCKLLSWITLFLCHRRLNI